MKDFPPLNSSASKSGHALLMGPYLIILLVSSATTAASLSVHVTSFSSTTCWSSLFHSEKAAKLQYPKPQVADSKPSVFILKSVNNLGFFASKDCLVGQFLGGSPHFPKFRLSLGEFWAEQIELIL